MTLWTQPAVRRLILRARTGEAWATIGAGFYPDDPDTARAGRNACQVFRRHASWADIEARRRALKANGRNQPQKDLTLRAAVISAGRQGDAWAAIGSRFYLEANCPTTAAYMLWQRHASQGDREARKEALRANNHNRNPGLSPNAIRRHRQRGFEPRGQERSDPFAGQGACFA